MGSQVSQRHIEGDSSEVCHQQRTYDHGAEAGGEEQNHLHQPETEDGVHHGVGTIAERCRPQPQHDQQRAEIHRHAEAALDDGIGHRQREFVDLEVRRKGPGTGCHERLEGTPP